MSLSREVTIWCDECGQWDQASGVTATQLRKYLKQKGWTTIRHYFIRDYCPECSKNREKILKELIEPT
jgi:Zn finger protein HypA/HybF involved in hydrogenase expression